MEGVSGVFKRPRDFACDRLSLWVQLASAPMTISTLDRTLSKKKLVAKIKQEALSQRTAVHVDRASSLEITAVMGR